MWFAVENIFIHYLIFAVKIMCILYVVCSVTFTHNIQARQKFGGGSFYFFERDNKMLNKGTNIFRIWSC